jgi:plasmid stabilization system protein ParE
MVKAIVWRHKANKEFNAFINYLQEYWGENATRAFVKKTYQTIELLSQFPDMGTLENYDKQIRGFVITKHNTLFYRTEETQLIFLSFFDNRQHPKERSDI